MPLPPDHQRQTLRRLSARERWLVRAMSAVTAVVVIAVIVSLAATGPSSGHGCVRATFPGPVGAEQVDRCGAGARALCATLRSTGAFGPEAVRTIAVQCRKAGLAVGA